MVGLVSSGSSPLCFPYKEVAQDCGHYGREFVYRMYKSIPKNLLVQNLEKSNACIETNDTSAKSP